MCHTRQGRVQGTQPWDRQPLLLAQASLASGTKVLVKGQELKADIEGLRDRSS